MAIAEDFLGLLPLFPEETEQTISDRRDAWANEGVSVEDPDEWVDTRVGSFFQMNTQGWVQEAARCYDLMGTEMVAATFVLFSWGPYLDALAGGYEIERLAATPASGKVTFFGPEGTVIPLGTVVGVSPAVPDANLKEYEVTESGVIGASGEIELAVEAREAGLVTDAGTGQVTEILSAVESSGAVTVANAEPIFGGTDPESDEALRSRVIGAFGGRGSGNIRAYEVWAGEHPGVGKAIVIPVWNGPGTVKVILLTSAGQPVSGTVVAEVKAELDPVAGKGHGKAPVGHTVTVETAAAVNVKVTAVIEFNEGFTLTGAGGTLAMKEPILEAVAAYLSSVRSGDEAVLQKVASVIAGFDAVHDIKEVKLNGSAANVAIGSNPAKVATLDPTSALTEGAVP
jgi:uncharacterized phage protein gp47/JayE